MHFAEEEPVELDDHGVAVDVDDRAPSREREVMEGDRGVPSAHLLRLLVPKTSSTSMPRPNLTPREVE
jgi:hypothetical protein